MTVQTNQPEPTKINQPIADCALGRALGDCQLRRAGCGSLYDVLIALYPPPAMLAQLRNRPDIDPDVARWVARLDQIGRSGRGPVGEALRIDASGAYA